MLLYSTHCGAFLGFLDLSLVPKRAREGGLS
jgi:hypothetical protein